MTHSSSYEISTKEFFSILEEEIEPTESLGITKVMEKLSNNIFNHLDGDINLDYYNIQACLSDTQQGIIQVVETNKLSVGLDKIINDSMAKINTKNLVQHIVLHLTLHPSISLLDIATFMNSVHDAVHEEADVCLCISYNNENRIDHIEIESFIFYKF